MRITGVSDILLCHFSIGIKIFSLFVKVLAVGENDASKGMLGESDSSGV